MYPNNKFNFSTFLGILALSLAIGTAYDYLYRKPNKNRFLMAFSIPSNAEKLFMFSTVANNNNINCLNGIRVLSMIWVIYAHSFITSVDVPKINYMDYLKWSRTFFAQFTHNAFISVDSFFFLSGLLMSWIGVKKIENSKGRIHVPLMYLHRYIRITPMLALHILFILSLLKFMGDGPFFDQFIEQAADQCEMNWWKNLLYIQNYASNPSVSIEKWFVKLLALYVESCCCE